MAEGKTTRHPSSAAHGELVAEHLDTIIGAVDATARRRRLCTEHRDDLLSFALEKLVERERKIFGAFQGLGSWRGYLERVIERLWLDLTYACRGRWRPTARARRLGTTAVQLDRLVRRDGLEPLTAAAAVECSRPHRSAVSLIDLARELATVRRPRSVPLGDLDPTGPSDAARRRRENERRHLASTLIAAVRQALAELPAEERRLVRLRFLEARSGRDIAHMTGVKQNEVYRRLYAVLRHLARQLERRGFDRQAVREATDSNGAAIIPRGVLDETGSG